MGRPWIKFDDEQLKHIETLAAMGASNESIGQFMGCSADTLERNYAGVLKEGKDRLRNKLRLMQVSVAMKGNVTMLIWLGKQLLGQTDKYIEDWGAMDGYAFRNPKETK